jgi:hypothetical protein
MLFRTGRKLNRKVSGFGHPYTYHYPLQRILLLLAPLLSTLPIQNYKWMLEKDLGIETARSKVSQDVFKLLRDFQYAASRTYTTQIYSGQSKT